MRYSTVPAINFEALVVRNREIIANLPQQTVKVSKAWSPSKLRFV